jgi:hypothetical protein
MSPSKSTGSVQGMAPGMSGGMVPSQSWDRDRPLPPPPPGQEEAPKRAEPKNYTQLGEFEVCLFSAFSADNQTFCDTTPH